MAEVSLYEQDLLRAASQGLPWQLLDGKNVKLDDLAIFGVGIRGKPADTSKDWSVTTNVVGLRLKCRATGTLAINQLKLEAKLKELSPYDIESGNTGGGGEEERPGEL